MPTNPRLLHQHDEPLCSHQGRRSTEVQDELLVLWTDFFKPQHLEANPDLHTTFWMAAKLCSACKVEVSEQHAQELMDAVEAIHNMFWATKGRDVSWVRAS